MLCYNKTMNKRQKLQSIKHNFKNKLFELTNTKMNLLNLFRKKLEEQKIEELKKIIRTTQQ